MTSYDDTNPDSSGGASRELEPASRSIIDLAETYRLVAHPGNEVPPEDGDIASKIWDLLRIVDKRKWLILGVTSGVLAIGTVRTLMTTPLYISATRLQIDRNVAKIVDGASLTPVEGTDTEFLRTQYELLQSRSLAQRVAGSAHLADDSNFFEPREFSILRAAKRLLRSSATRTKPRKSELTDRAASIIQQNIAVQPVAGSRLVDLNYSDPDPARSQRIIAVADDGSDTHGGKDRPPTHVGNMPPDKDIPGKQRRRDFVNPSCMARLFANNWSVNLVALFSEMTRRDGLSMGLRIDDQPNRLRRQEIVHRHE